MKTRFFDFNATTPLCGAAKDAWLAATEALWLNPSSPYRSAAGVKVRLEAVRENLADQFGVVKERVVFNSGATEGNNAVIEHWAKALPEESRIAVSPTEHPSVTEAAKYYFKGRLVWLNLETSGAVDVSALRATLAADDSIRAVSVMAANNETGVLNDWSAIAEACKSSERSYHCDASQWIGKLPLDGLGLCNFVTGCGHKFGGPKGVGFMLLPETAVAFSSLVGGVQEAGFRAGTEDVAGIMSMAAALESVSMGSPKERDQFIEAITKCVPKVEILGLESPRLWNTVALLMPDFESARWIRGLEKRGFLISSGAACSTGKDGPSHVLSAMKIDATTMRRALRISSHWETTDADWESLVAAFEEVYLELKQEGEGSSSQVISI